MTGETYQQARVHPTPAGLTITSAPGYATMLLLTDREQAAPAASRTANAHVTRSALGSAQNSSFVDHRHQEEH